MKKVQGKARQVAVELKLVSLKVSNNFPDFPEGISYISVNVKPSYTIKFIIYLIQPFTMTVK